MKKPVNIADKESIRNPQSTIHDNGLSSYLVGGVNSPVRTFRRVGAEALMLSRSRGAYVWDGAGQRYTDFIMGWGALILGHNPPPVVQALKQRLNQGVLLGLTHAAEHWLARYICQAVPGVEQVRFTVSGTEACMTAVKVARAHTGRQKILAFEGCYHGHGESLIGSASTGLPKSLSAEIVSVPFNDAGAFDQAMAQWGPSLACVIIEPVAANMGVVPSRPGFLKHIRRQTRNQGVVLIFDEVVTAFRLGFGAAPTAFGVEADLTTFGKIIGGGMPIGALGGRRRLMRHLAPEGGVYHGGTFAGHPLAMAAGLATLESLKTRAPYERMEYLASAAAEGLLEAARSYAIAIQINRAQSMLSVFFTEKPVHAFAEAKASRGDRFAQWANGLRQRRILVPPSPYEALFFSTAHTAAHVAQLVQASRKIFAAMKAA